MKHWVMGRYGVEIPTKDHPKAAGPERAADIEKALEDLKRLNAARPRRKLGLAGQTRVQ